MNPSLILTLIKQRCFYCILACYHMLTNMPQYDSNVYVSLVKFVTFRDVLVITCDIRCDSKQCGPLNKRFVDVPG